jgi:hypothetical protein
MFEMRSFGLVAIVAAIALGALLVGFWSAGWTKRDVKKLAGTAQDRIGQIKEEVEAAVQAATG